MKLLSQAFVSSIGYAVIGLSSAAEAADKTLQNNKNNNNNLRGQQHQFAIANRDLITTTCSNPASSGTLTLQATGSYPSTLGTDCFYVYWDDSKCNADSKCPLFVYVDGTTNAQSITDRDTYYLQLMADNGYVAVSADYNDVCGLLTGCSYLNGCDGADGFRAKSAAIFEDRTGSVINQLCNSDTAPVDCSMGIASSGWSQGAHIAALARDYNAQVTGALLFANGNYNDDIIDTPVPCVNDDPLILPKERRRSLVGELDNYFGGNYAGVLAQQMATSGYDQATGGCPSQCFEPGATSCNCLHLQPEGCNYGTGEQQCLDESSPNFLRFYNLGCQVDGVSQCTEASSCGGLASGACPFAPDDPQQTAGFYIIAGKGHGDFKDDPFFKLTATLDTKQLTRLHFKLTIIFSSVRTPHTIVCEIDKCVTILNMHSTLNNTLKNKCSNDL